ncbi:DoxX family protein [Jidongwangia harbinensis]|uniref:DoxX family protein n=1 Tax=Jidongwangia harbinensis TaxID=2878561 RepID=UPI001CD9E826|nr:DoxX family protein [Jidongwangia harbinensis]MCA2211901.1 DoxX family protein [Jidongwangia harbinensis]
MDTVLWIIAAVLAVAFVASGAMKLLRSREQLAASGMGWAPEFSAGTVKLIGALEVLAGIGLILPALLDIAPVLVPLAALGLILVMIGAAVVHARRKEYPLIAVNAVLLILAAVVAWGRFGPYPFS